MFKHVSEDPETTDSGHSCTVILRPLVFLKPQPCAFDCEIHYFMVKMDDDE